MIDNGVHAASRLRSVNDSVIKGKGERQHLPDFYLPVHDHGLLHYPAYPQNGYLRVVDNG